MPNFMQFLKDWIASEEAEESQKEKENPVEETNAEEQVSEEESEKESTDEKEAEVEEPAEEEKPKPKPKRKSSPGKPRGTKPGRTPQHSYEDFTKRNHNDFESVDEMLTGLKEYADTGVDLGIPVQRN